MDSPCSRLARFTIRLCVGRSTLLFTRPYSQAKFIVIGTPSGISLSPEGGAHQSLITPGIGVQLPGVTYYEPAYALELEWILLAALAELQDRDTGKSAYLRLSTKPLDQAVFNMALERDGEEDLRQQVLQGGYRLLDWQAEEAYHPGMNVVHVFVTGAMLPEAVEAAQQLKQHGVFANVFNVTSADVLFHDYMATQQQNMQGQRYESWVEALVPVAGAERSGCDPPRRTPTYSVVYWWGAGNADDLSRGDRVRTVRHPGRPVPTLRDCAREYCRGRPLDRGAGRLGMLVAGWVPIVTSPASILSIPSSCLLSLLKPLLSRTNQAANPLSRVACLIQKPHEA